ncbi:MAG: DUF4040 domain-containing protein [Spirochaetes bacterium]|nr:DUF4040 domain-containing protein [Spirochaetota bacterium]
METLLIILLLLMIAGAIYALEAKDLLSAVVSFGIVGFGLVICFLLLQAPDLAIVQVVVEVLVLVIMIAVIINTTREEIKEKIPRSTYIYYILGFIFVVGFIYLFAVSIQGLSEFGKHSTRMATEYIKNGAVKTGSMNLVSGVVLDFRGYDTLGEITILFTAVVGILTILRLKGRKHE